MDKQMETAQLLARFKLQVKRSLGETVDLERLTREPAYARQRLNEVEDAADDEDLLIMVLRLRDLLLPVARDTEVIAAPEAKPVEAVQRTAETRSYMRGARAW
ncbi:hypothetical protein [Azonexus hydrophilus]|uniref:Uncharacterized protein n=1 Tax=Azonexus hydrophilus TaxID=418702 RepID=A0ABZ2XJW8_9RHOO|nr:hypothetical protein [Azonexus hydrophilus]